MPSKLTLNVLDRVAREQQTQPPPQLAAPTQPYIDPELLPRPKPQPEFRSGRAETRQPLPPPRSVAQSRPGQPNTINLQARTLKVTVTLDAAALGAVEVAEGAPRQTLRIQVAGRAYSASIASKSVRKTIRTIREVGADGVFVTITAKLVGEELTEAGLSAMPKTPRPAPEASPV
jgi:hypothetical protein